MKLLKFNQFIFENRDPNAYSEETARLKSTADELADLLFLGLIDDSGYKQEFKKILSSYQTMIKGLKLDTSQKEDLELLAKISQDSGIRSLAGLDSEGAKALFAKGLHIVSSPTQLSNGTLVFSLDPNYRRSNGWGIGFFPHIRAIRRMTPKQIAIGVWGRRVGSMDIIIKKFPQTSSHEEFYNKSMQWAADNIDFAQAQLNPEPTQWKYYKKKKGADAQPRDEAADLLVKANELYLSISDYHRAFNWGQATPEQKKHVLSNLIEVAQLRLKAANLTGDSQKVKELEKSIEGYREMLRNLNQ
jgi:hypothetical protein